MLARLTTKRLLLVLTICLFATLLNLLNVIIWALNVPPDRIYLGSGHYYPDYLASLQIMSQGQRGNWLIENAYTTDELSRTFLGWGPDLLLGKISSLLHLSLPLTYWLSVGLLSLIVTLLIFYTLSLLLADKPFSLQLSAFLLALFSGPFLALKNGQLIPFDYWYAPIHLFARLGGIPRHLLELVLALTVINLISQLLLALKRLSFTKGIFRLFLIIFPLLLLFFFSLLSLTLSFTLFILGFLLLLTSLLKKDPLFHRYLLIFSTLALFVIPTALFIKHFSLIPSPLSRSAAWDLTQQAQFTPTFFILITGPILIFSLLGLPAYLKHASPLKSLFIILLGLCLFFLYTPIPTYFGTISIRLLTPLNWITLGTLAVLGMEGLASRLHLQRGKIVAVLTFLLLLYSLPAHIFFFQKKLTQDRGSLKFFGYFPQTIYQALQYLNQDSTPGAVLTRPETHVGLVVPVFTPRKVYLGHHFFTLDPDKKDKQAKAFYQGEITPGQACRFLAQNHIGFVLWTFWDGAVAPIQNYSCLIPAYQNHQAIVFRVKS